MRRFELVEGGSSKFWEVATEAEKLLVRFGRLGTSGQSQEKAFDTAAKAEAERDKLIREKTKKGYKELATTATNETTDEPSVEKSAAPKPKPKAKPVAAAEPGWLDAGGGYSLALEGGKIKCRNAKGQLLGAVPKELKEGDAFEQLDNLREFLASHERECQEQVESWMLRSLPTPRAVLTAVWADPAWRRALENAVVVPEGDPSGGGFFRGVDEKRGIGVVDRDGETVWLAAESVSIPHPISLEGLDDLRALSTELGLTQGIGQLFREVYPRQPTHLDSATKVSDLSDGNFKMLNHALSLCKRHGFRVSGGSAVTRVWELDPRGELQAREARYWIGSDDPMQETTTGDLVWVDERERALTLGQLGPVAFSEGMRMANAIYAGRFVEKEVQSA
jgi:predicted DNA-binding WGR domain protein